MEAEAARKTPGAAGAVRARGRPRKTASQRDDGNRRVELVRVAARLFRRQGFDGTSTRDIAAAAGMRSGSPFYHFKSKGALLAAVMEEGMRAAMASQTRLLGQLAQLGGADASAGSAAGASAGSTAGASADPAQVLRALVRNHFDVLLGPDSDFIPVMLYEWRSITPRQRTAVRRLKDAYEALWVPALQALHQSGRLGCDPKHARLLIFGALNWAVQWYDPRLGATLDELTDSALGLFLRPGAAERPARPGRGAA